MHDFAFVFAGFVAGSGAIGMIALLLAGLVARQLAELEPMLKTPKRIIRSLLSLLLAYAGMKLISL